MKKLKFTYTMNLKFSSEVINHEFALKCIPKDDFHQKVYSLRCRVDPVDSLNRTSDGFGNNMQIGHCDRVHDFFNFEVSGIVWVDRNNIIQEKLNPIYKYPSKYTEFHESMTDLYLKAILFEGTPLQRVLFLMNRIYEIMEYTPGATNINTTAGQALVLKKGVCQDYSHILIAICKKCNIAARYVVGMIIGEGETHAWVEIYYDGCWYGLDPTNNRVVDNDFIKISHGRDYEDCIIDKGVFSSKSGKFILQEQNIYVSVEEKGDFLW